MPEWTSINIDYDDCISANNQKPTPSSSPDGKKSFIPDDILMDDFDDEDNGPKKIIIPSAKKMREETLEGIKIGKLPEYQDYSVVLQYLVTQFTEKNYKFNEVMNAVPWLGEWLSNSFNSNLLNEELELAARLEASRIHAQIEFMLKGGCCSKTCGKCCACMFCCVPLCPALCKIIFYFADLFIACLWSTLFDWWIGEFCRRYICANLCFIPIYAKIHLENWIMGDALFEDEELSIKNIYDSNSYRIANQYACLLCLAIVLAVIGFSMVITSYAYLQTHPDQLFIKVESILGIMLFCMGFCGLQFFCRCTL